MKLMTDPFGKYLCQKLLEFCNDEECTVLIKNASHDHVRIALNKYGAIIFMGSQTVQEAKPSIDSPWDGLRASRLCLGAIDISKIMTESYGPIPLSRLTSPPIAEMFPRFNFRESEYDAPEAPKLMSRPHVHQPDAYAKILCKRVRRGIRRESCPKCLAVGNSKLPSTHRVCYGC
jgi:hypothetical protein